MMKRTVSMFLCSLALTVGVSYGAINITWGVSGQQLKDNNGLYIQGTNSATGYLVGGFVQLIWTGADGQIAGFDETFSNGLNPVWDDRVAATGWMGEGVLSNPKAGRFSDTESVSVGNSLGATFYIRFFTAPAGTFASGIIPAASWYGDVSSNSNGVFALTQGNIDSGSASFSINSPQQVTEVYPVPEPSSLALLGVGVVAILLRRKLS